MLAELLATRGVREIHVPGGRVGLMALHGGLEHGTWEIARDVAAATGASLYAVVQPPDLRWHVPSIRFDPNHSETLRSYLRSVEVAVSVHGFGRKGMRSVALLGGRNRPLAARLSAALETRRGLRAVHLPEEIPPKLRGMHPRNPVNRPPRCGVQIELTADLRLGSSRNRVASALAGALVNAS
jgi:phage replication-related protein YjqB (UPF0714/DUF867 family)